MQNENQTNPSQMIEKTDYRTTIRPNMKSAFIFHFDSFRIFLSVSLPFLVCSYWSDQYLIPRKKEQAQSNHWNMKIVFYLFFIQTANEFFYIVIISSMVCSHIYWSFCLDFTAFHDNEFPILLHTKFVLHTLGERSPIFEFQLKKKRA